jgi:DNA-binding transcriptional MerR regulator
LVQAQRTAAGWRVYGPNELLRLHQIVWIVWLKRLGLKLTQIGAILLNQTVTWNVVSPRYRDSFDRNDHYNTPQVATGFTYKLNEQASVTAKIMRNWRDGDFSSTGVSLGFKQKF